MSDLKMTSLKQINEMTLTEFNYRMYALRFDVLKEEYERYKLAFAIRDAAATKNEGTEKEPKEVYRFKSPNDILDYEVNYNRLLDGKEIVFTDELEEVEPENNNFFKTIAEINNSIK
ncbi:TPA: hypothetical protein ACJHGX_001393 [Staphylococcus pseudintermedius]